MAYLISSDTVILVRSLGRVYTRTDLRDSMMNVMFFFHKHNISPKSTSGNPTPSIKDDDTDTDWCPIKEILNRKMQNGKERFLVRWDDDHDSESWVLAEDVTDYAIQQYYKGKETKKRLRRRRQ